MLKRLLFAGIVFGLTVLPAVAALADGRPRFGTH